MNNKTKRTIKDKARLAYGLSHVLKDDIDILRVSTCKDDWKDLISVTQDTRETVQKLLDTLVDMEYYLYLSKFNES